MSEKFAHEDEIDRRVSALPEQEARAILASIVSEFYGPESDPDWSPDSLEAIQGLLKMHRLVP